jgi:Escherichia/Staphylococcus phage prohead protease
MELAAFFDALAEVRNLRSAPFDDLEISATKIDGEYDGFRFEGHAAVFDEVADFGDWTESVERGSFRKLLNQGSGVVPLLHEHDRTKLLASTRTGRLRLSEDTRGLKVEADVVDTPLAREVRALAQAGEVRGMSWGAIVGPGNFRVEHRGGKPHRSIHNFKALADVSTTWEPSYAGAEAEFRSLAVRFADSPESLQQLLKGAYPQLGDGAFDFGTQESLEETPSGVSAPLLAARKRRLQVLSLTLEGGDLE